MGGGDSEEEENESVKKKKKNVVILFQLWSKGARSAWACGSRGVSESCSFWEILNVFPTFPDSEANKFLEIDLFFLVEVLNVCPCPALGIDGAEKLKRGLTMLSRYAEPEQRHFSLRGKKKTGIRVSGVLNLLLL